MPECTIGGRPATVQTVRVRHVRKEWGWYNRVTGRFLDNDETFSLSAGEFAKWSTKLDKEYYGKTEAAHRP